MKERVCRLALGSRGASGGGCGRWESFLGWLKIENNREAALALLAVATALLGGGWFLYDRLVPGGADGGGAGQSLEIGGDAGQVQQVGAGGVAVVAGAGAVVTVGYTIEQHEAALARQEKRIRKDLKRAHTAEKRCCKADWMRSAGAWPT